MYLCPQMVRTFKGKATDFKKVIEATLSGDMWPTAEPGAIKVLMLAGSLKPRPKKSGVQIISTPEFLALKKFKIINGIQICYAQTQDRKLPGLEKTDILWLGCKEVPGGKHLLGKETEDRIKSFVMKGGIVIASAQSSGEENSSTQGSPWEQGWIPEGSIQDVSKGHDIPDKEKRLLLSADIDAKELAIHIVKHHRGRYILTALQNRSKADVKTNAVTMEKLIKFALQTRKFHSKEERRKTFLREKRKERL